MSPPSPNGGNGRDGRGRFAEGNVGGPGNPHARHVGQLRSALLAAVTREDIEAVIRKLVELAKNGNIQAAKEVFDRCLGKPQEADLIERIEHLQQRLRTGVRHDGAAHSP